MSAAASSISPAELSVLFIHGFKPMSSDERLALADELAKARSSSYGNLQQLTEELSSPVNFQFFSMQAANGARYFIYASAHEDSPVVLWHIGKQTDEKLAYGFIGWNSIRPPLRLIEQELRAV